VSAKSRHAHNARKAGSKRAVPAPATHTSTPRVQAANLQAGSRTGVAALPWTLEASLEAQPGKNFGCGENRIYNTPPRCDHGNAAVGRRCSRSRGQSRVRARRVQHRTTRGVCFRVCGACAGGSCRSPQSAHLGVRQARATGCRMLLPAQPLPGAPPAWPQPAPFPCSGPLAGRRRGRPCMRANLMLPRILAAGGWLTCPSARAASLRTADNFFRGAIVEMSDPVICIPIVSRRMA